MEFKIIDRAYALQAAQFDSFYPRFIEAFDAASRCQAVSAKRMGRGKVPGREPSSLQL